MEAWRQRGLRPCRVVKPSTWTNGQIDMRSGHRFCVVLLLAVVALCVTGCQQAKDPALALEGGCDPSRSPFLPPDADVEGRISFCEGDDGWKGTIETSVFPAGTRDVEVMIAGYPGTPGVSLSAVATDGAAAFAFATFQPRERWERALLQVPPEISATGFRIRIEDQSAEKFGWAGLGASTIKRSEAFADGSLPLLAAIVLGNAWLIALALCLPHSAQYSPRSRILQGMLVSGCVWMLAFVAYVVSPKLGGALSLLMLALPFPLSALLCRRRKTPVRDVVGMQIALLPTLALAMLVLWVGLYPFNWQGQANGDPALRWPHLSTDAWLPMIFGDMLVRGHLDVPMVGDWLSSDRPPLQVGLYLLFHSLLPHSRELVYQGISTWAQALVLVPVAALLARLLDRRAQATALLVVCLSPMLLLNTLYVWPKLLAAAFSLIYYMVLFPKEGAPKRWGVAGVAASLALLSHGGALFFLIGASLISLAWYQRSSFVLLLRAAPVAAILYAPWIVYQKFIDPPGDRLVKWHFAGKVPVSDETAMHAIRSAYADLTPASWLAARLENLAVICKGAITGPLDALGMLGNQDRTALVHFLDADFFHTFHSLWLCSPLLLVPCIAWIGWQSRTDPAAKRVLPVALQMVATVTTFILVWATTLFNGGTATINTGAYAGVILLHLAVLVALYHAARPVFYLACLANVAVALSAYMLDRIFITGLQGPYLLGTALLAAVLAVALIAATRRTPPWGPAHDEPT